MSQPASHEISRDVGNFFLPRERYVAIKYDDGGDRSSLAIIAAGQVMTRNLDSLYVFSVVRWQAILTVSSCNHTGGKKFHITHLYNNPGWLRSANLFYFPAEPSEILWLIYWRGTCDNDDSEYPRPLPWLMEEKFTLTRLHMFIVIRLNNLSFAFISFRAWDSPLITLPIDFSIKQRTKLRGWMKNTNYPRLVTLYKCREQIISQWKKKLSYSNKRFWYD